MFDFDNYATVNGLATLALLLVFAYYIVISGLLRIPRARRVSVTRYEPPEGASPAVAAWLYERGRLPRAMAAALVSMAAKGYIKIEQTEDLVTIKQIATITDAPLEPEEHTLQWSLLGSFDTFDFSRSTSHLSRAAGSFRITLLNTGYFLPHVGLSVPAWIVSGIASFFLLFVGNNLVHGSGRGLGYLIFATIGCFVVAVRTLSGTVEKAMCRIPGSTAPKRPWTGADFRPLYFLAGALAGISLLGMMSSATAAFLLGGFAVVNAVFYFALQSPSARGRVILGELADYEQYIAGVEADTISRTLASDQVPAKLDAKRAYAIAFHLDLGWGEQFVGAIAEVIEVAQVFEKKDEDDHVPTPTGSG